MIIIMAGPEPGVVMLCRAHPGHAGVIAPTVRWLAATATALGTPGPEMSRVSRVLITSGEWQKR